MQVMSGMNPTWGKNWNRVEATMWLLVDLTHAKPELMHEALWRKVVSDTFEGTLGRLTQGRQFGRYADDLQTATRGVSARMSAVGLRDAATLPPIVWIRLMQEANLAPVGSALHSFRQWSKRERNSGNAVRYVYIDADGKRKGPRLDRDGLSKLRGYSADDLLKLTKEKPHHWPYCREWVRVVGSPEKPAKERATSKQTRIPAKKVSPVAPLTSGDDAVAPKRKTRRRSRKEMVRACGARVFDALEQSLAKEVSRKKSLLVAGGRNRRAYNCDLSLNELVAALKAKYAKQLNYKDSTLKSALPHFVSCPRGRPGGIDPLLD